MIPEEALLKKRWEKKRVAIYTLKDNIEKLKRKVRSDLTSSDEKNKITALIVSIMLNTSERVGKE